MKNLTIFTLMIALIFGANQSIASVIFYDDAEDYPDTSSDWIIRSEYGNEAFVVSAEKARAGANSYKFILGGKTESSRVELVLRGLKAQTQIRNFLFNQVYWMGWSVFIPNDIVFPDRSKGIWGLLGQYHGVDDDCDTGKYGPLVACYLDDKTGGFEVVIKAISEQCADGRKMRYASYGTPKLKKGAWNDIVVNFRFNYVDIGNPFFKMWLNGQLVVDDKGPNCYNDKISPYFKMGIYTNTTEPTTVYYDEIRVGDESSSYIEVAPKGMVKTGLEEANSLEAPVLKLIPVQ